MSIVSSDQTNPMRYLTIDGMLSGTGIRDSVSGGYIDPLKLGLSVELSTVIEQWVKRYEQAHFFQFEDAEENERLDREGLAICNQIRDSHPDYKINYYSSACMKKIEEEPK